MTLTKEERRKKLIAYAEKFPIDEFPGITSIFSTENTYINNSIGFLETIGFKTVEESYDVKFENINADAVRNHAQWEKDCQYGIENNKLVRFISYGNYADGWKVYFGHHKPIVDKESNGVIGILANYIDMTENSIFDVGRLIMMENDGLKRKQFQYRIQEKKGFERLTKREQEVLFWFNHGINAVEIAQRLSKPDAPLTDSTVRTHIERIMLKFKVTNKKQLLEKSISIGFMCTVPESLFVD
jgi:DNA-binding CsgD family transcriptional regulator